MWKIPLFDLNYGTEEEEAVRSVLKSKWLSSGEQTSSFEDAFGQYLGGSTYCCAVANGTAALHLALLCTGVGPGDEVIISGLTFVADLNVVTLTGARPVLADIKSLEDWNISPKSIEEKISQKTRAVIAVHYAGWPCDMDEIRDLCHRNKILLIEDAAHAPGAEYKGGKCGTLSDFGCFSFFSNKNLSTGEGGMVTTADPKAIEKIRLMRSHGMTSMTIDRHKGKGISYDVAMPGFNYRMDEIRSALGIVQLKKLDRANEKRRDLIKTYIERLSDIDGLSIPWKKFPEDRITSGHIFPILLKEESDRTGLILHLKSQGIQTSIHYPAMNGFHFYKDRLKQNLGISDQVSKKVVTLPLFPGLSTDHIDIICKEIRHFF